jgi:hypothetical protein
MSAQQHLAGDNLVAGRCLDAQGLAAQIHLRGGVLGALASGLRADQIRDAELASEWAQLERGYGALLPHMRDLERRLSKTVCGR